MRETPYQALTACLHLAPVYPPGSVLTCLHYTKPEPVLQLFVERTRKVDQLRPLPGIQTFYLAKHVVYKSWSRSALLKCIRQCFLVSKEVGVVYSLQH